MKAAERDAIIKANEEHKSKGTNHTKNGGPRKKAKAKIKSRNKQRDKQAKKDSLQAT